MAIQKMIGNGNAIYIQTFSLQKDLFSFHLLSIAKTEN